jgi:uncharacterized membrane protein
MKRLLQQWDNHQTEEMIGNLLRAGVMLAAAVVLVGGVIFLARNGTRLPDYQVFRREPGDLENVPGIVRQAFDARGRGVIQLGLLILIATPIARVVLAAIAFALQRDHLYVLVSLAVLAILIFSLSGHAG